MRVNFLYAIDFFVTPFNRNINATSDEEYKKNIAAKAQSHYRESAEDRPEAIAKRRLEHCGADFDEEDGTEVEDIHSDSDDFKRQDASK